uniref:carbonic anhydrase n=1 Tax=Candidatus Kentrum sp. FM TaxID=2126340 RepID=A0A450VMZ6_9GAMM|nr:MAG: carbonic anhydrase [Candidatus Kentron sp. FM]VFJ61894.1 MAG: carbonic anhydrase [Candidatus Kentron sp. FM]VFK06090.1 MAG: carbonic anhydrase [Candidatus Kentron sp. FM]
MNRKLFVIALTASAALFLNGIAFAKDATHGHASWSYEGATGPENWGDLDKEFVLCKTGTVQSPIDITGSTKSDPPSLDIQYQSDSGAFQVLNNGHTIKVTNDAGNRIDIDNQSYNLLQFHFHTPSENQIDGKAAAMEVHLVHQNADKELAVVGVLIEEGKENSVLTAIWEKMPQEAGEEIEISDKTFDVTAFLPEDKAYFHFMGSLTTPPCSEQVRWFVMKNPIEFSSEQIAKFKETIGHSVRPVQPLNGRDIFAK